MKCSNGIKLHSLFKAFLHIFMSTNKNKDFISSDSHSHYSSMSMNQCLDEDRETNTVPRLHAEDSVNRKWLWNEEKFQGWQCLSLVQWLVWDVELCWQIRMENACQLNNKRVVTQIISTDIPRDQNMLISCQETNPPIREPFGNLDLCSLSDVA